VKLKDRAETVQDRFGTPTKEGASWMRFDDDDVALHFETDGGVVSRITLMTARSKPR
jgi:hypothetical protein